MSSAVEAISCSKAVDIAATVPEETAKERLVVAAEHGNGDCAGAATTNGKKCVEAAPKCRKEDEDDDEEDGEKVPEHIDLGPILSIKDQLEKDKVCILNSSRCNRILPLLPIDR
jgi:Rho GDP-dissociation inhibitor